MHYSQIPADEMAAQYALLSREHQGLQKSYQLLASTTAAASSSPDYHPRGACINPYCYHCKMIKEAIDSQPSLSSPSLLMYYFVRFLLVFHFLSLFFVDGVLCSKGMGPHASARFPSSVYSRHNDYLAIIAAQYVS